MCILTMSLVNKIAQDCFETGRVPGDTAGMPDHYEVYLDRYPEKLEEVEERIEYLLEYKSPIHLLCVAAKRGNLPKVKHLVNDTDVDVNEPDGYNCELPLQMAIEHNQTDVVRYLLMEGGCDPEQEDGNGADPLFIVTNGRGKIDVATMTNLLIKGGLRLNRTFPGWSRGHEEIWTPLTSVLDTYRRSTDTYPDSVTVAKILYDNGANPKLGTPPAIDTPGSAGDEFRKYVEEKPRKTAQKKKRAQKHKKRRSRRRDV